MITACSSDPDATPTEAFMRSFQIKSGLGFALVLVIGVVLFSGAKANALVDDATKEFTAEDFMKVKVNLPEAKVIELLGKPTKSYVVPMLDGSISTTRSRAAIFRSPSQKPGRSRAPGCSLTRNRMTSSWE